MTELWHVKRTAEYLGVSENQVWQYVREGLPVCVLSPQVRRFVPADVEGWVHSKRGNAQEGRAVPSEKDGVRSEGVRVRANRTGSRVRGGEETEADVRDFRAAINAYSK